MKKVKKLLKAPVQKEIYIALINPYGDDKSFGH